MVLPTAGFLPAVFLFILLCERQSGGLIALCLMT